VARAHDGATQMAPYEVVATASPSFIPSLSKLVEEGSRLALRRWGAGVDCTVPLRCIISHLVATG
jgi:hypothetical protein